MAFMFLSSIDRKTSTYYNITYITYQIDMI